MTDDKPEPEFVAQQLRKPSGDFADTIAEVMDQVNAPLFDLTLQTMQLSEGESILEIGFGSGTFFDNVLSQCEQLKITGLDYSQEMVTLAQELNQPAIDAQKLTLTEGNSYNMPWPDRTFDKVYCNMVVYFWDQPVKHLQEIHRVLKPGGKFYTGIRSKESMQKLPFVEFSFNLYTKSGWNTILSDHGFEVTKIAEKLDPEMEIEDKMMQMKSICIVADKK